MDINYQRKGPPFKIQKRNEREFYKNNVLGPKGGHFYQKHLEESGDAVWQRD